MDLGFLYLSPNFQFLYLVQIPTRHYQLELTLYIGYLLFVTSLSPPPQLQFIHHLLASQGILF